MWYDKINLPDAPNACLFRRVREIEHGPIGVIAVLAVRTPSGPTVVCTAISSVAPGETFHFPTYRAIAFNRAEKMLAVATGLAKPRAKMRAFNELVYTEDAPAVVAQRALNQFIDSFEGFTDYTLNWTQPDLWLEHFNNRVGHHTIVTKRMFLALCESVSDRRRVRDKKTASIAQSTPGLSATVRVPRQD